jgi:hypothetical protein
VNPIFRAKLLVIGKAVFLDGSELDRFTDASRAYAAIHQGCYDYLLTSSGKVAA